MAAGLSNDQVVFCCYLILSCFWKMISDLNPVLVKGHSMSDDPAKWRFFIWPSPQFTKFYKGKDLRLLSSTKLEFLKSDMYFRNYEHLTLMFFKDWTKKILEFCCWNFNWLALFYLWIFSFNILQQSGRLHAEQNNTKFFTGDRLTLVNRCYVFMCIQAWRYFKYL